ncbi:MAG: hypothetical protein JWN51_3507 [Phycisphaerales bacterium]|nr:hypothetical protein [Phycisphaerales bacterium]
MIATKIDTPAETESDFRPSPRMKIRTDLTTQAHAPYVIFMLIMERRHDHDRS